MDVIAVIQGLYYVTTGLWPIFNMVSFERFTGVKTDKWLVKMVGLLAASIGVVLLSADTSDTLRLLGILSAASFAIIDFVYSLKNVISKAYLGDGIIEILFILGWLFGVK